MIKVIYVYYGKYVNEKTFENYQMAKKFFNAMAYRKGVTRTELVAA